MKKINHKSSAVLTVISIIIASLMVFSVGCEKKEEKEIKIGAILPLTGRVAVFGKWHQQGFEIANEEIVEKNILNGKSITIIYGDSKNEAKEGVSLYQKFVTIDKIPIIISAMSGVSKPLIPLALENNTMLFFIDVTYPDITKESPLLFRHFIQSNREAEMLATYAIEELKLKNFATFYLLDETGLGAKDSFNNEVARRGGKVLSEEQFTKAGTDFRTQATKLIGANPEAIYVFGYGKSWTTAVKQLKELGFKGHILANTVAWFPVFRNPLGKSADGMIFSMPNLDVNSNNASIKNFVNRYRAKYEDDPPLEAGYAYDVLMMLAKAISKNGYGAQEVSTGLMKLKKFSGAFGKIEIDSTGEIETQILVRTIKDGKIIPLN